MLSFLSLANYFRKFIPNFSRLAAPLYQVTKKGGVITDHPDLIKSFEAIKTLLISPPLLWYPNPDKPYVIISDASISGCGAILLQEEKPVAYYSAKFTSAERNYHTGEQELLGIIKALHEWRCYCEGCEGLTIITDHNPLTFFQSQVTLSRRQARWSEFLSRFTYTIQHTPGVNNPADPLSRLYQSTLMYLCVTLSEFQPELLERIQSLYSIDPYFSDPNSTKKLQFINGVWYHHNKVVVPADIQSEIIQSSHSNVTAGHFGTSKTEELITRTFWWPRMRARIQSFIQSCPVCQADKSSRTQPFGLLTPLPIPDSRWHTVTMDFVMDLPVTSYGHDAIMVLVDKLTKFVIIIPTVKTVTYEQCARLFLDFVWKNHGMPQILISDRDTRFTSQF